MIRVIFSIAIFIFGLFVFIKTGRAEDVEYKANPENDECVVLLHGLRRGSGSMKSMAKFLHKNGYDTLNIQYPSTKYEIPVLTRKVGVEINNYCLSNKHKEYKKIHFVTHSMGGIITRQYLKNNKLDNLGRVVMLTPPNKGSRVVDFYINNKVLNPVFRAIEGPAAVQLTTNPEISIPANLGVVDFELGVIAGNKNYVPLYRLITGTDNDSVVAVENTVIDGMKEHIILPVEHNFVMYNKEVKIKTLQFLRTGTFEED